MDKPAVLRLADYDVPPIRTKRCIIEDVAMADARTLVDFYHADHGDYPRHIHFGSSEQSWRYISEDYVNRSLKPDFTQRASADNCRYFLVYRREPGNEKGAPVGMYAWFTDNEGRPRLSPYILPSYRKRGLNSEAYAAAIAHLWPMIGEPDFYAEVNPGNTPQLRVMEKLGAACIGKGICTVPDSLDEGTIMNCFRIPVEQLAELTAQRTARGDFGPA